VEPLASSEPDPCLDSSIFGYSISIPPGDCPTPDLFSTSLSCLPPHKPRLYLSPVTPHQFLNLVSSSQASQVDLFTDSLSPHLSTIGVALSFSFPAPDASSPASSKGPQESRKKAPIGHNLFSPEFSTDFRPLRDGETPTRAYIHHLLHSHEMTAHVLLSLHNHRMMQEFVASVREAMAGLDKEEFESEVRRFGETYEEQDLQAWKEAEVALDAVKKERGKGRLKESKGEGEEVSR
jgi:hypothetical protein